MFTDIQKIENREETVSLTSLIDNVEIALDEADQIAEEDSRRCSHEEVFANLRGKCHGK